MSKITLSKPCSATELKMLGDFWMLQIVQSLSEGGKRFCELERDLPAINPTTLSHRLKKMESQSIVDKQVGTIDKLSVTYSLTKKGLGILPILKEIKHFATIHLI